MIEQDLQLLRRYAEERDEGAFARLVERYLHLVYATALRRLAGNVHAAEDVTQCVFIDLARKAGSLKGHASLAGWLHTSACFAAAKFVRAEESRRRREEKAGKMAESTERPGQDDRDELTPLIDEALRELPASDREVLLLRYFSGHKLSRVGEALGVTDNAARMRVERALERLKGVLAKRGMTSTALSGLAAALQQASGGAMLPQTLATSVTAAVTGSGQVSVGMFATNLLVMKNLKIAAAAVLFAGSLAWIGVLRKENRELRSEILAFAEWQEGRESDPARTTTGDAENGSGDEARRRAERLELFRLRGRVTMLAKELEALKQAGQAATASRIEDPAPERRPWKLRERRAVGDFHDVGQATPEAAAETLLWAVMNDVSRLPGLVYLPDDLWHRFHPGPIQAILGPRLGAALNQVWLETSEPKGPWAVTYWDRVEIVEDVTSLAVHGAGADGKEINQGRILGFVKVDEAYKLIMEYQAPGEALQQEWDKQYRIVQERRDRMLLGNQSIPTW